MSYLKVNGMCGSVPKYVRCIIVRGEQLHHIVYTQDMQVAWDMDYVDFSRVTKLARDVGVALVLVRV
jgi:hypothetical protein